MVALPHSPRLRFRRVRPDDAERFDALDHDDGVLRFIDWEPATLDEQRRAVAGYIGEYERSPRHGRLVAESPDGEFLGWFALHADTDPLVLSLGYRLHRRFWGLGLATEGSLALVDYAFSELGAHAVYADTMFVNTASRRVMEKCGMTLVRNYHVHFDNPLPGTEYGEVRFEITREEWAERRDGPRAP